MSQSTTPPESPVPDSPHGMPGHVAWLATHRGVALQARMARDLGLDSCAIGTMTGESAVAFVTAADPSFHKKATPWLVETLIRGGYHAEDLVGGLDSKVAETLGWFSQHRRTLPRGVRNLEDHESLASVYRAVQPMLVNEVEDTTPTGRRLRRIERERARVESIMLHESPELRLVVPLTMFAAQWWGRGTRWCTSAERNNMFDEYNTDAPLVIAVLPDTRYQMWLGPNGSMQFMDQADDKVVDFDVAGHRDALHPLLEWACARGYTDAFRLLDECARTPEICWQMVGLQGRELGWVPSHLRTPELCRRAMENSVHALRHVPPEHVDAEMAVSAAGRMSIAVLSTPPHLLTRDVYLAAVQGHPAYIQHVPEAFLDRDFCMEAIANNYQCINCIPNHMLSDAMHMAAVESNPLYAVYNSIRKPDLLHNVMIRGVQKDVGILKHFRNIRITPSLLRAAQESWPFELGLIEKSLRTPELCRACVAHDGAALFHVPHEYIDQSMCWQAVQSNPMSLFCVPPEYKTAELCTAALGADSLTHPIPLYLGSREHNADKRQKPGLLQYVPADLLTPEMCLLAVQRNGCSLASVPMHMQTHEMYVQAVRDEPRMFYSVPLDARTPEIRDIVALTLPRISTDWNPDPGQVKWSPDCLDGLQAMVAHSRGQATPALALQPQPGPAR